ncbi:hypothetical protein C1752_09165 [Acaryochloris thomasi RCC1774]|uniref:Uncharacterized protein n=1 Tax=Acaryochloris thomasi RCC1774 TaxID=1764569 RepID=A0A2W1J8Y6_9CYAN|nr:hypothetical protein [Acaryochloris thomasi]PZD70769.1 hypothetical protein C1752_09165 [Acaryochloris thomasi RCC1774]
MKKLSILIKPLLATTAIALMCGPALAATWAARHGMTSAQYQQRFDQYVSQGYRLSDVSGYSINGKPKYAAIWSQGRSVPWVARHGMTSAQYQQKFDQYVGQGYQLVDVSGYESNGQALYAALWQKRGGTTPWQARHGMSVSQYQQTFNDLVGKGYRLTHVSAYNVGGKARFAAIWRKGGNVQWQARHGMTSSQYQAKFDSLVSQGYRLSTVSGYEVNGIAKYAALWVKGGSSPWQARHGLSSAQYQLTFNQLTSQGYRLTHVSGYEVNGQAKYAAIWRKN